MEKGERCSCPSCFLNLQCLLFVIRVFPFFFRFKTGADVRLGWGRAASKEVEVEREVERKRKEKKTLLG